MKTIRLVIVAALSAVAALSTGCVSRTIAAASTRLEIINPGGRSVVFTLPKEYEVEGLVAGIDPATGLPHLKFDKITAKSAPVIDAAGAANAAAITALAGAVQTLTAAAAKAVVVP